MIVISDTNVLSTLAAGAAFPALCRLYGKHSLAVPPSVQVELQAGLEQGKTYLQPVLEAVLIGQIKIVLLSAEEEFLTFNFPFNLGAGEREAIALAQTRQAILLSNDKEAVRYCQQKGVRVVSLVSLLRLLWVEQVMSVDEVRALIRRAGEAEKLTLTPKQMSVIFAAPTN